MVTKRSLALFHSAAAGVPAYADFLKSHSVNPSDIKKSSDFRRIPITSKKTYLQQYALQDLLWEGGLNRPLIFCATSGSTGEPYYFPRDDKLAWQYSWVIEEFLKRGQEKNHKPVLIILAFGMGVWIGGVITLRALEIATARMKFPASILPVGYNLKEIKKALERLSPQFGQTLIIGYPPFVKEIVDEAGRGQINLKKFNTRLIFAAESFTEKFREYLVRRTGADPVFDTLNIYGTADIGAMAYETPLSIFIRRQAVNDKALFENIFGQINKTPTLAQFNPRFVEFESVNGEILLTGNSAVPLIRYAIGDHGGVLGYQAMRRAFSRRGLDLDKEAAKAGVTPENNRRPFVYVYERSNFAVSLIGIIIYPEYIKEALIDPALIPHLSGKFTMLTRFDKKQNQFLEVNIELQAGEKADNKLRTWIGQSIRKILKERSSEFTEVSKNQSTSKLLKVVLWPYQHPKYFSPGAKQKWMIEEK